MNLDDHALFLAPCLKENEHQKNKAKGKNKKKGLAKTKNEYQNLKKYWSKSSYLKRKNYKDNSVNTKSKIIYYYTPKVNVCKLSHSFKI